MVSEYERIRQKNLDDNRRILAELGLMNPFRPLPQVIKKAPKRKRQLDTQRASKFIITTTESTPESLEGYGSVRGSRRRSSRLQGKAAATATEIEDEVSKIEDDEDTPKLRAPANRPNVYGWIPGVDVGTQWLTRLEACIAGIHRPTVAGIHGGPEGAYSIALSGGYEDDIDMGEMFTYTGEGGRDLKGTKANPKNLRTAPQSKDQMLTRGNLALSKSVESGHPVRVVRGYKLNSPFAPDEGYRYDGLYKVEKFWFTIGISGFGVYKFALKRLDDQAPPPWDFKEDPLSPGKVTDLQSISFLPPKRTEKDVNTVYLQATQDSGVGSERTSEEESDAASEAGSEGTHYDRETEENGEAIMERDKPRQTDTSPKIQKMDQSVESDAEKNVNQSGCKADVNDQSEAVLQDAKVHVNDQSEAVVQDAKTEIKDPPETVTQETKAGVADRSETVIQEVKKEVDEVASESPEETRVRHTSVTEEANAERSESSEAHSDQAETSLQSESTDQEETGAVQAESCDKNDSKTTQSENVTKGATGMKDEQQKAKKKRTIRDYFCVKNSSTEKIQIQGQGLNN